MKRSGLIAVLALVVLVNVIVLAGVRYNRSSEPEAAVTLTERELHLRSNSKENSGVSLKLEANLGYNRWNEVSHWFDRKKLEAVGFDCSMPVDAGDALRYYERSLPRQAYVVLEYEGKAWEDWLVVQKEQLRELDSSTAAGNKKKEELESERRHLRWEMEAGSRLFVIDAGSDAASLRTRYSDRHRYIITPAKVRMRLVQADAKQKRKQAVLSGYVDEILCGTIHVSRDRLGVLASLKPQEHGYYDGRKEPFVPRYRVTLNYGWRYEPWVAEVIAK